MKSSRLIWAGIPLFLVSVALIVWWLPAWWHYYHDLNWMDRAIFNMDRRGNLPFRFYGLVVDQDGKSLRNVTIEVKISAFNENWAYEKNGANRRGTYAHKSVVSGADGRFAFDAKGDWLQIQSVTLAGYEWLYDKEVAQYAGKPFTNNTFFRFSSEGEPWPYQSRRDSPAIFVLVKNGVKDVRAMPSRGGVDLDPGHRRTTVNHPVWPLKPSIPGIHYVSAPAGTTTSSS